MAGANGGGRSLEQTPTWAVAVICFIFISMSVAIEYTIGFASKLLKSKHKRALHEALEKVKSELMLLGFISLLLSLGERPLSKLCIPEKVAATWHPCTKEQEALKFHSVASATDECSSKGKVAFVSSDGIHQLHLLIFVLAIFHVIYCITTLALGRAKMRCWKAWEKEVRTAEYQSSHDPERLRLARETSFGRRHLSSWSETPFLLWVTCFFRQFVRSIDKVDYVTLRHGFIMAHLTRESHDFDFQKYISKSLEEDFKVVVGISPPIWFYAVLFLLFNTHGHGWYSYLWLPFFPLIIILFVGTALQVTVTKMGLRILEGGEVVMGVPVVQPGDDLFWFNRPRLHLYLINFVLFQNAFQLAYFAWSWYEFGMTTCLREPVEFIIIKMLSGIVIQIVCSYVTLPLYALVTQMGTSLKRALFSDQVATALRNWHHRAKTRIKKNKRSAAHTPTSSRPATRSREISPV